MDLIDIYRIFHPTAAQYSLFSAAHGTFSKLDHILGHKPSLHKYKKIEITLCILSDHNRLKLKVNSNRKYMNTCRMNNIHLNNH
jgi:exonuclease III